MIELVAVRIVQTVDLWIWAIIMGGFFIIVLWKPKVTLQNVLFRYIHCFAHLFIIMAFCCRGHKFDFFIVPIWVLFFFYWIWLSWRLHLVYDAQAALKFDRRLDNLEEFLLTAYKLVEYRYKPQYY